MAGRDVNDRDSGRDRCAEEERSDERLTAPYRARGYQDELFRWRPPPTVDDPLAQLLSPIPPYWASPVVIRSRRPVFSARLWRWLRGRR